MGGGRRADNGPQVFHLFPEHLPALALWNACQTQWRVGMSGRTGLDYSGVRASPAFRRIPRAQREAVFADVVTMEYAWLGETARLAALERQD